jgi:hypothetical protein
MRTKQVITGLKNSQKIRIIIDGVGIYTTVGALDTMFHTITHRQSAMAAARALANSHTADSATVGLGGTFIQKQVQIDLI